MIKVRIVQTVVCQMICCCRVLGPTAVLQLAERDEPPPANTRPLYSLAMRGVVICFSGFRKKDELVSISTKTPVFIFNNVEAQQ